MGWQDLRENDFNPINPTNPINHGSDNSYDIVTKEFGGQLKVEAKESEGMEFIIVLSAIP